MVNAFPPRASRQVHVPRRRSPRRPGAVTATTATTDTTGTTAAGGAARRFALVVAGSVLALCVVAGSAVAASGEAAVLAAAGGVVAAAATRARRRSLARRHRYAQRAAAEDLLAVFADELEAGGAPTVAFGPAAATAGGALPELVAASEPADALRASDVPALRQLAAGWQVSTDSGIRLAPIAIRLSASARAAGARDRELRAALAGPRASGRLVASLPLVAAGLGACVGASPHRVLFGTGTGLACLLAGMVCDLAGLAWMNRLADNVEHRCDGSHTLRGDLATPPNDDQSGNALRYFHPIFHPISEPRPGVPWPGPNVPDPRSGRNPGPKPVPDERYRVSRERNQRMFGRDEADDGLETHSKRRVAGTGAIVVGALAGAVAVVVAAGAGHLFVPLLGLCVTGAGLAALARMRSDPARTHHARLVADLPIALDLVAACLAAGTAPGPAQKAVGEVVGGPLGMELAGAAGALQSGGTPREAYGRLLEVSREPSPLARLWKCFPVRPGPPAAAATALVDALERSDASGARLVTTLERVADRSRDEAHAMAIEAARRAGVVAAAPLGLCFLPAFVLLGVCPVILAAAPGLLAG